MHIQAATCIYNFINMHQFYYFLMMYYLLHIQTSATSLSFPMFRYCSLLILIHTLVFVPSVQAQDIIYPGTERDTYNIHLLKHALAYFPEKNYQVKAFGENIPKRRFFDLMVKNEGIDVMISGATIERERRYLPVRFPILMGLNGWRIPLVNKNQSYLFENVDNSKAFKRLIPGQFHTWSDSDILKRNGIKVSTGSNIEGLFTMLHKGRFDYFPRSVLEIQWEMANHQQLDIVIDQHALIHYPTAYYYYVNKNNHALAADINQGLEKALADGSFKRIFQQYYGYVIDFVKSSERKIFRLKNPILPKKTPLNRKELWLDLEAELNKPALSQPTILHP